MKVVILLLAFIVCFTAVNTATSEENEAINLELFENEAFANEVVDFETRGIFRGFFWIVKAALRTLKGVNCSIKQVMVIKSTCQYFPYDIKSCGDDAVKSFKNVISATESVVATCNDIIDTNENVCKNDESINGNHKTPFICFIKLSIKFHKLRQQINNTLHAIKKVPAIPGEAAICSNNAADKLISVFTSFPSTVKTCSKLTS